MTTTRDDRADVVTVSRRGAHRPRPNPLMSLLPFVAVAAVVAGAFGLMWMLFLRGGSETGSSGSAAAAPSVLSSVSGAATAPSASAGSSSSAGSDSGRAAATVDKTITLDYFNGTSAAINGQARRAHDQLQAAGWTSAGKLETWTGPRVSQTTVYYADASQLASARAVVKALGGGTVKLNTGYASATSMAVVIGDNYQP